MLIFKASHHSDLHCAVMSHLAIPKLWTNLVKELFTKLVPVCGTLCLLVCAKHLLFKLQMTIENVLFSTCTWHWATALFSMFFAVDLPRSVQFSVSTKTGHILHYEKQVPDLIKAEVHTSSRPCQVRKLVEIGEATTSHHVGEFVNLYTVLFVFSYRGHTQLMHLKVRSYLRKCVLGVSS